MWWATFGWLERKQPLGGISHSPLKIIKNACNMQIYFPGLEENKNLNLKKSLVKLSSLIILTKCLFFLVQLSPQMMVWKCQWCG